jgi:dihydropyrimidinase
MYEGMPIRGVPDTVLLRGEVIVRDRAFVGRPGMGRFIPRRRYGPVPPA